MARPRIGSAAGFAMTMVAACTVFLPASSGAGNGDPVDGIPGYRVRALLALTTACRQDPVGYRRAYGGDVKILHSRHYPAVPPLYASTALGRQAGAHSRAAPRDGCFQ